MEKHLVVTHAGSAEIDDWLEAGWKKVAKRFEIEVSGTITSANYVITKRSDDSSETL